MKKTIVSIFAVALLAGSQVWATSVTVTRPAGYSTGDGGEFNIAPVFTGGSYAPTVLVGSGFETFCLDASVNIGPLPATYNATLAAAPVSLGTAWLYYQFATGTLAGYAYTSFAPTPILQNGVPHTVSARAATAYGLQNAIWILEGSVAPFIDAAAAASWLTLVEGATGDTFAQLQVQNNQYQVARVLLTDPRTQAPVQNMLALVPDGGWAVMLLGMGLSGLALISRKVRA